LNRAGAFDNGPGAVPGHFSSLRCGSRPPIRGGETSLPTLPGSFRGAYDSLTLILGLADQVFDAQESSSRRKK
jgi:hypothetical protein